jgi:hypothetical protein
MEILHFGNVTLTLKWNSAEVQEPKNIFLNFYLDQLDHFNRKVVKKKVLLSTLTGGY